MKEEISLTVEIKELFGVYWDPTRDERFHTASVIYICKAYGIPLGADDAKEAMIISLENLELNKLVFDYGNISYDYIKQYHQG